MTSPAIRLRLAHVKGHVPKREAWYLCGWLSAQPYSDEATLLMVTLGDNP